MAKTKSPRRRELSEGPGADAHDVDDLLGELPPEEATPAVANPLTPNFVPRPALPPVQISRVEVEAPLAQHRPEVRQFSHVELQLTQAQGRVLRQLFDGLYEKHEQMANGKHVDSAADCVRWLLDKLEQRYEIAAT